MPDTSDRFLRLNAVLDKTGLSRSTLYRKIQDGTFPKQVAISTRCAAWVESDIEEWMRNPMFYSAEPPRGQRDDHFEAAAKKTSASRPAAVNAGTGT